MPQKGDPARGWLSVEKLLVDDEVERIARLSDEQVLAEMGMGPSQVPSAERLMKKAAVRSAVGRAQDNAMGHSPVASTPIASVASDGPRRQALLWLVAAAFVFTVVLVAKRDEIATALRGHPPPSPPQQPAPPPPGPSPQELAAVARAGAQKACAAGDWLVCSSKLDEAKGLDPAGEETPAVRQMRKTIGDELEAKPRPRK